VAGPYDVVARAQAPDMNKLAEQVTSQIQTGALARFLLLAPAFPGWRSIVPGLPVQPVIRAFQPCGILVGSSVLLRRTLLLPGDRIMR
jgi:hypothetical protein